MSFIVRRVKTAGTSIPFLIVPATGKSESHAVFAAEAIKVEEVGGFGLEHGYMQHSHQVSGP